MEGAWMNNIPVMSDGCFRIRGGKIGAPTAAVPDKSNECLPMEKACEADQNIVIQSPFLY